MQSKIEEVIHARDDVLLQMLHSRHKDNPEVVEVLALLQQEFYALAEKTSELSEIHCQV